MKSYFITPSQHIFAGSVIWWLSSRRACVRILCVHLPTSTDEPTNIALLLFMPAFKDYAEPQKPARNNQP